MISFVREKLLYDYFSVSQFLRVVDCILMIQLTFCTQDIISYLDTLLSWQCTLTSLERSDDSSEAPPAPPPLVGRLNPARGACRLPARGAGRLRDMLSSWLPLGPSGAGTRGALVLSSPSIWIPC